MTLSIQTFILTVGLGICSGGIGAGLFLLWALRRWRESSAGLAPLVDQDLKDRYQKIQDLLVELKGISRDLNENWRRLGVMAAMILERVDSGEDRPE